MTLIRSVLIAGAVLLACVPAHATGSTPSALQRLIALNPGLRSYSASIKADIQMHSFPYLGASVGGTYYHKDPGRDKIVFTSGVPFMAKQFSNVYPHIESPARWNDVYTVSVESDRSGVTTLKMVPRSAGRIQRIEAKIADATGELMEMRWAYDGGGYATMRQTYSKVGKYLIVTGQTGHFEDPDYNADVTSSFSNFKINAAIPDSVFSDQ